METSIIDHFILIEKRLSDIRKEERKMNTEYKDLKTKILSYLKENGLQQIAGNNGIVYAKSKQTMTIAFQAVQKLFRALKLTKRLKDVATIKKTDLEKVLSKEQIETIAEKIIDEYADLKIK